MWITRRSAVGGFWRYTLLHDPDRYHFKFKVEKWKKWKNKFEVRLTHVEHLTSTTTCAPRLRYVSSGFMPD